MSTLVTGATGLVGNNVVRSLLQRGESVRVLARQSSDPRPLEGLDVEVVRGDIRDYDQVRQACQNVDVVVHSAAYIHIGWRMLEQCREINVAGTRNVAEAARSIGLRMIHVSTVDTLAAASRDKPVDEDAVGAKVPCTYVVTKREAEQEVLAQTAQGLDAVIVNPGFMLGPWDWKPSSGRMLLQVARRPTPFAPPGGMSVCDVRDVAEGIIAAAERGKAGQKYILAGHNVTYLDAWKQFSQVGGRKGAKLRMGPLVRFLAGRGGDLWTQLRGHEGDVNSAAIGMSCLFHYYSSARAENELDYRFRPLRETIEDAWNWFIAHGYV